LIAHSLGGGAFGIDSFLILEFVDGHSISSLGEAHIMSREQRQVFYKDLADIFLQLRRLTFPAIGSLAFAPDGTIQVGYGPDSVAYNIHALEGLQPSRIRDFQSEQGVFGSSKDYISAVLSMTRNGFEKSRATVLDESDGNQMLYYLHSFDKYFEEWVDESLDKGPFVLMHGDFVKHNLLIDDDMRITAVLDWEWSRVVPLQLFHPPLWMIVSSLRLLSMPEHYLTHVGELDRLRAITKERELALYGNTLLTDEWSCIHERGGLLAVAALEGMDLDGIFYFGALYHDNGEIPIDLINEFIAQDPTRAELIAEKVRAAEAYDEECKILGLGDDDREVELNRPTPKIDPVADEKQANLGRVEVGVVVHL
jgi:hypothetical protein